MHRDIQQRQIRDALISIIAASGYFRLVKAENCGEVMLDLDGIIAHLVVNQGAYHWSVAVELVGPAEHVFPPWRLDWFSVEDLVLAMQQMQEEGGVEGSS
jgi:hypothetical protein